MKTKSGDCFTVTVLAALTVESALVRVGGDIDMTVSAELSAIADRLATKAPACVVIDLAGITFACSALPNFLAQLRHRLPAASTILLCRPTAGTRQVLLMTGMDQIATLSPDLPYLRYSRQATRGTRRASTFVFTQN
ncbi:STAS domain-containing protein [Actinoplanes sp. NPDC023801]|uniref:STAS domain-containing protein n=1 Tax=Actinoplanes sp. NPDC023801 TaxID=3154595 RepID=UPI0033EF4115